MELVHVFVHTACEIAPEPLAKRHWVWPTSKLLTEVFSVLMGKDVFVGRGRFGKPYLLWPHCGMQFSVSHDFESWWCVVAKSKTVGLDVEHLLPALEWMYETGELTIAERAFLRSQKNDLDASRVFFQYWTLKEAYVKALGYGLTASLAEIEIQITGGRIKVRDRDAARTILARELEFLSIAIGEKVFSLAIKRPDFGHSIGIVYHGPRSADLVRVSSITGVSHNMHVSFYEADRSIAGQFMASHPRILS